MFLLPYKISSAAENMRIDSAMLSSWAFREDGPRLRFYGWRGDCFTCGMSQNPAEIAALLPYGAEIAKRPSGGGIVDHRADATYALVVPRGHPLCEKPARESYRDVHEAIAARLRKCGFAAALYEPPPNAPRKGALYSCFASPSEFDVMLSGAKAAGAAQKRNRFGILFQGSINRKPLGRLSPDALYAELGRAFEELLGESSIGIPFEDALGTAPEDSK